MYLYILNRIAGQSKMLNEEPQAKARIERNKKKNQDIQHKEISRFIWTRGSANDSTAININMEKKEVWTWKLKYLLILTEGNHIATCFWDAIQWLRRFVSSKFKFWNQHPENIPCRWKSARNDLGLS